MSRRTTVDPPMFWLESLPGAVGDGVPDGPPDGLPDGLPDGPGTVTDGEGDRPGGTEKGSRPVKLWIGGPPSGGGLGELVGSGVSGIGGNGSSPPPSTEKRTKPARRTPMTPPPIVTVRRSRSDSAIVHPPWTTTVSVGPGSEPGPALRSLVYNVIVAVNVSVDPSVGARVIASTVAARGSVSISCRYFTIAKYEHSPLAETEMVENPPFAAAAGVPGVRLRTCTPATEAALRRKRITADRSAVGGTCCSIRRIVASFRGASSRACSRAF